MELGLRKQQANRYINALQDVIAEKSFKYTHVIRPAPSKSVITRARNSITKLNDQISFFSRVYNRCHAAMICLAADPQTLRKFKDLRREHVKASSAVVDPNIPGSTNLRLSWIWQTATAEGDSPGHLCECKIHFHFCFNCTLLTQKWDHSSPCPLATCTGTTTSLGRGGDFSGI